MHINTNGNTQHDNEYWLAAYLLVKLRLPPLNSENVTPFLSSSFPSVIFHTSSSSFIFRLLSLAVPFLSLLFSSHPNSFPGPFLSSLPALPSISEGSPAVGSQFHFCIFSTEAGSIDPYNFELCRFKVGAFLETQCMFVKRLPVGDFSLWNILIPQWTPKGIDCVCSDAVVHHATKPQLVSRQQGVVSMWCKASECWCHCVSNDYGCDQFNMITVCKKEENSK